MHLAQSLTFWEAVSYTSLQETPLNDSLGWNFQIRVKALSIFLLNIEGFPQSHLGTKSQNLL